MKKAIITVAIILAAAANAQAERTITINNGISGLLMGAGGGALAGQAIGRDTESTLIGTAVGTLFGYMVGNEMDKSQGRSVQVMHQPAPVYPEQRSSYRYRYEPVQHQYQYENQYESQCREVEILGTVSGAPERILTTACPTPEGWVLVDPPGRPAVHSQRPANYSKRSEPGNYRPTYNSYTRNIRYPY